MIAVDMDGTLLDDEKNISPATCAYLKQLSLDGHLIILASGRPLRTLKPYHDLLGLTTPLVCYNGSYVLSLHDPDFPSFKFSFPHEHLLDIIHRMDDAIVNVMIETTDDVWLHHSEPGLESFYTNGDVNFIYGDPALTLDEDALTLIIRLKDDSLEGKRKVIESVVPYKGYEIRFWHNTVYAELYEENMTKRDGLKYIANHYGIDQRHTIAFGDAENDLQMLDWAEIGVAMSNGNDIIKLHSDLLSVDDNNHDGVMKTLKLLLNQE